MKRHSIYNPVDNLEFILGFKCSIWERIKEQILKFKKSVTTVYQLPVGTQEVCHLPVNCDYYNILINKIASTKKENNF